MIYKSFLAIAIFCFAPYAISAEDPPTTGTLLGDARLIITSKKDDVRLWLHPPRVLVLYDGKDVSPRLENIRNVIEENVSPFYADKVLARGPTASYPPTLVKGRIEGTCDTWMVAQLTTNSKFIWMKAGFGSPTSQSRWHRGQKLPF